MLIGRQKFDVFVLCLLHSDALFPWRCWMFTGYDSRSETAFKIKWFWDCFPIEVRVMVPYIYCENKMFDFMLRSLGFSFLPGHNGIPLHMIHYLFGYEFWILSTVWNLLIFRSIHLVWGWLSFLKLLSIVWKLQGENNNWPVLLVC